MTDVLRDLMEGPGVEPLSLTIDDMRAARQDHDHGARRAERDVGRARRLRAASRPDRPDRADRASARSSACSALLSGVAGIVLAVYIAMSLGLLWSEPARRGSGRTDRPGHPVRRQVRRRGRRRPGTAPGPTAGPPPGPPGRRRPPAATWLATAAGPAATGWRPATDRRRVAGRRRRAAGDRRRRHPPSPA